jgi:hypothetical protein
MNGVERFFIALAIAGFAGIAAILGLIWLEPITAAY